MISSAGIWSSRHGSIGASPIALSVTSIARISNVVASMLEKALRHAHRLTQGQTEQALDRQAELDRHLAVHRAAAPLAAGTTVPAHILVHPDEQRASRLQRLVVFFPIGRSILRLYRRIHAVSLPAGGKLPSSAVLLRVEEGGRNQHSVFWSQDASDRMNLMCDTRAAVELPVIRKDFIVDIYLSVRSARRTPMRSC